MLFRPGIVSPSLAKAGKPRAKHDQILLEPREELAEIAAPRAFQACRSRQSLHFPLTGSTLGV